VSKPKFIVPENYQTKSQRYDELLAEGIELIQKFSGNQWTDYNFHDPGITFLEQICFAITDLGYKSNFPVEDILFIGQDKFDLEKHNLLFPPHTILPSNPITSNDLRKLIIDKIDAVQNAWVYPDKDNLQNISGLLKVKVQLNDTLDEKTLAKTLQEVDGLLMQHRSLGTDFNKAEPLKKDEIRFECDISLDSFAVGEQVLAHMYKNIEESISNKPIFHDFKEMEEEDYKVEDLFSGTYTEKGFLKDFNFNEKTNEIYISEIKESIYGVEGVLGIENLVFFKNGIKIFDDYISFDKDSYPSLIKLGDDFYEDDNEGIRFSRNESYYKIDKIIFRQIYDSLVVESKQFYRQKLKNNLNAFKGRFSKEQFEKYYSLMRELPSLYGLKEDELPSKSTNLRKAQVNQLRAYLLLFDQIMANHVSQLAHVRDLFSVAKETNRTLYEKIPTDVPNLDTIVGDDISAYEDHLKTSLETKVEFYERKNKIVNHLLARFGETFDTTLLGKIYKLQNENCTEEEMNSYKLNAKIRYANNIVELGYERSQSSDYTKTRTTDLNLSGIEKRLKLKLGLPSSIPDSILKPFLSESRLSESELTWRKKTIQIENGPALEVLSLPQKAYADLKLHFYLNNISSFKYLFVNGLKRKNYKIVKTKENYLLLYNGIDGFQPAVLFQSKERANCENNIDLALAKIKDFNEKCEGFYLVENILLRPVSSKDYTLFFYDEKEKKYMESYFQSDIENLRDLKRDFSILATDKKNYNVEKKINSKNYQIIIYDILNKPLFKSCNSFKSETDAKIEIPQMIQFYKKVNLEGTLEEYSKIVVVNDLSNKFPDDFNFSNHINFIFPDWPFRFQNKEFRTFIKEIIEEYISAHLTYDLFFLNIDQMNQFEQSFLKWEKLKNTKREDQIDSKSLQLIQLLMQYKKDGK